MVPTAAPVQCPRGPVVVSGQDHVAALAGCPRLDGDLRIRTAAALRLDDLASLETVTGSLVIGPTLALDTLDGLRGLREVGGALRVVANGDVTGAFFPALERAGAVEIDGNVALLQVMLPRLREVTGDVVVHGNAALELVDVTVLARIGGALIIEDNVVLTDVAIGTARAGSVRVLRNAALDSAAQQRLQATAP